MSNILKAIGGLIILSGLVMFLLAVWGVVTVDFTCNYEITAVVVVFIIHVLISGEE